MFPLARVRGMPALATPSPKFLPHEGRFDNECTELRSLAGGCVDPAADSRLANRRRISRWQKSVLPVEVRVAPTRHKRVRSRA